MKKLLPFVLGLLIAPVMAQNVVIHGRQANGDLTPLESVASTGGRSQLVVIEGAWDFEEVAASATDQTLGATGASGDYLSHCLVTTVTAATATFGIEDGSNTAFDNITVQVGAATLLAGSFNTVVVNARATTAAGWEITTGAGATAACFGDFT